MTINTYSLLVFCGLHDSNEKRKKKTKTKRKLLPRTPRERTAIRVRSSPVGIANIKVAIVKVIWCCSGPIPAFRILQQEIHLSLNSISSTCIAIMVITVHTLKWPFISHREQHHKQTSQVASYTSLFHQRLRYTICSYKLPSSSTHSTRLLWCFSV